MSLSRTVAFVALLLVLVVAAVAFARVTSPFASLVHVGLAAIVVAASALLAPALWLRVTRGLRSAARLRLWGGLVAYALLVSVWAWILLPPGGETVVARAVGALLLVAGVGMYRRERAALAARLRFIGRS